MYSAIKKGNKRLHQLARAGETVERAPRSIVIHALSLLEFTPPRARIAIACSKGTYVRSLVDDLGRDLGCGAHLTALRRTRSGRFSIDQAISLDALTPESARAHVIPARDVLDVPRVTVPDEAWVHIRNGVSQRVRPLLPEGKEFQLLGRCGALLALVHLEDDTVVFDRVLLTQPG
jgi:tRNA pseudouridine55 synthase